MNINKHLDFIDPNEYKKSIHIIGVGAIGSRVAEQIARLGFKNIVIYDFDTVEDVNIANQLFTHNDIGKPKVQAVKEHMEAINPNIKVKIREKGWVGQPLNGAVFLAVDSIEIRQQIVKDNMYNDSIDVMIDTRMRLTDAQYFGANWSDIGDRERLLSSMDFTEEEADLGTPLSACGTTLSVVPTVISIASIAVANFINFINEKPVKHMVLFDPFEGNILAIDYNN